MGSYKLSFVKLPYKRSTIPSKMIPQPLMQKYFKSLDQFSLWCNLLKHLTFS